MKRVLGIFVIIWVVLGALFYLNQEKNKVCFMNKKCVQVDMADTRELQKQGLMNVSRLGKDKGMFFIFDKLDYHPIWMKNTLIPLDIVWINGKYEIVDVRKDFQPCKTKENCETYIPNQKAKYILEVNAGILDENDIKQGDVIKLEIKN